MEVIKSNYSVKGARKKENKQIRLPRPLILENFRGLSPTFNAHDKLLTRDAYAALQKLLPTCNIFKSMATSPTKTTIL